jgi:drug/metabolite transporter (DMT)-like permease
MPIVAMLLAILCWSSALVGNKALLATFAVSQTAFVRLGIGALILWLLVAAAGQLRATRAIGRRPIFMGVLDPGLTTTLMVWGISLTTATHAALFWAAMPVMVPLLARVFLGEALRPVMAGAAALVVAGTGVLVAGSVAAGAGSVAGDLLCLAGVTSSSVNALVARRAATVRGLPMPTTALQLSVASLLALAALMVIERPPIDLGAITAGEAGLALYLGVFGSAAPFLLYNYALRHLAAGATSLFAPLVGPIGAALAALTLGETVGLNVISAIVLILAGVFLPRLVDLRAAPTRARQ